MTKKLQFKVRFGYKVGDYVVMDNRQDLEKVVWAFYKKSPIHVNGAFLNGSNFISITPHWHAYTGWNEYYEPEAPEDWKQIERDAPKQLLEKTLEEVKMDVYELMGQGKQRLIGKDKKLLNSQ